MHVHVFVKIMASMVQHARATPQQHQPTGTQHVQATSKEDKMKLQPSVATGCVDGSTPMVWHGMARSVKVRQWP